MVNRLAGWGALIWTVLMGLGIFAAYLGIGRDCAGIGETLVASCQSDAWARGFFGLTLLVALWFVVFAPLALSWFFTRPRSTAA